MAHKIQHKRKSLEFNFSIANMPRLGFWMFLLGVLSSVILGLLKITINLNAASLIFVLGVVTGIVMLFRKERADSFLVWIMAFIIVSGQALTFLLSIIQGNVWPLVITLIIQYLFLLLSSIGLVIASVKLISAYWN